MAEPFVTGAGHRLITIQDWDDAWAFACRYLAEMDALGAALKASGLVCRDLALKVQALEAELAAREAA